MNPCFAPANMKSFEPFMMQYLDRFILRIQQMANRNDGIVEMSGLSYNLLLDVYVSVNATKLDFGGFNFWFRCRCP